MSDLHPTADALLASLPALREDIAALKARPWAETTEELETLDRAKMNVLLSYAINDLIWVYLKTVGVDPATHEVSAELERIKRYYGKIQAVENPSLDKAAAHRFITASIPLAQRTQASAASSSAPSTSAQAQAAADARAALGLDAPMSQEGAEVDIGSSGDTSKAGRFRFIPRQAEKARARAEDAWDDVDELKDDHSDREGEDETELPVASGSKIRFDEDGEVVDDAAEEVFENLGERLQEDKGSEGGGSGGQSGEDAQMADEDDRGDEENDDGLDDDVTSPRPAAPAGPKKAKADVKEKKERAKQADEAAQSVQTSKASKKNKKKKQKKAKAKPATGS